MKLWFKKATGAGSTGTTGTASVVPGAATEPASGVPGTKAATLDEAPPPPAPSAPPTTPSAPPAPPANTSGTPPAVGGTSSRALFRQYLDGQYDAVLITDLKGHIVNTNRRAHELFGFGPDETWDLPVSRLIPGITDTMIQQILGGLARERYILIEGRCARKNDGAFAGEIAISQITLTNDGNLLFCVRNIERRHQAQQRLQSARRLLDQIPTPAVACDRESRIRVANLALARMLGHESPDILADQPFACVWNEPRAAEVIARVLGGETVKEPITVMNLRGKPLQLILSIAPEQDAREKAVGFLASFTSAAVVTLNNR